MTPDSPLLPITDEELAEIVAWTIPTTDRWCRLARRLIAALRAERQKVKELQAEVKALRDDGYRTQREWYEDYARW